jgi:ComF family protein
MGIKEFFGKFFTNNLYNPAWKCEICGREKFDEDLLCEDCKKKLPYNNKYICFHCGRQTIAATEFCSTCGERLTALDRCRSVFVYKGIVTKLITRLKYNNKQYLVDFFVDKLAFLYWQNYFNADYITYVPMSEKAFLRRGYNQSKLLAEKVSKKTGVPLSDCVIKVKETKRQAKLNRKDRLKNLEGAFRVVNKANVKDKTFVIIDDVTTTGATAQAVAERLKKAGAIKVYLISVASTPPYDKY